MAVSSNQAISGMFFQFLENLELYLIINPFIDNDESNHW